MRTRTFLAAALTLLAPTVALAAAPMATAAIASSGVAYTAATTAGTLAFANGGDDDDDWRDRDRRKCGRGNAWGCRRDDRYDRYDRYDRDDDYRRRRVSERIVYERYEYRRPRGDYRYDDRYRRRDRRYFQYDNRPTACLRAGGRAIDWAVVVVCLP